MNRYIPSLSIIYRNINHITTLFNVINMEIYRIYKRTISQFSFLLIKLSLNEGIGSFSSLLIVFFSCVKLKRRFSVLWKWIWEEEGVVTICACVTLACLHGFWIISLILCSFTYDRTESIYQMIWKMTNVAISIRNV